MFHTVPFQRFRSQRVRLRLVRCPWWTKRIAPSMFRASVAQRVRPFEEVMALLGSMMLRSKQWLQSSVVPEGHAGTGHVRGLPGLRVHRLTIRRLLRPMRRAADPRREARAWSNPRSRSWLEDHTAESPWSACRSGVIGCRTLLSLEKERPLLFVLDAVALVDVNLCFVGLDLKKSIRCRQHLGRRAYAWSRRGRHRGRRGDPRESPGLSVVTSGRIWSGLDFLTLPGPPTGVVWTSALDAGVKEATCSSRSKTQPVGRT